MQVILGYFQVTNLRVIRTKESSPRLFTFVVSPENGIISSSYGRKLQRDQNNLNLKNKTIIQFKYTVLFYATNIVVGTVSLTW